jgi:acyl dehydratase
MAEDGKPVLSRAEILSRIGQEIGVSDWIEVSQAMIDSFADLTRDHQYIHIDPARAAETPFGGTVAHGFLTLSLLAPMVQSALPRIEGVTMAVNYGFDRIRFVTPVRAGARIRGRFTLAAVDQRGPAEIQWRLATTVEIEGEDRPALVADWLGRRYFGA